MSNGFSNLNGVEPLVQPYVDFWKSIFESANDQVNKLVESVESSSDTKVWQRRWSEAVSKSMDAYMRSPAFLQAMKQNTDLMIKAKQRTDDMTAEIARNANIPTAGDISGLFERLHSVEETILQRLDRIEGRLKDIETQTGATAGAGI